METTQIITLIVSLILGGIGAIPGILALRVQRDNLEKQLDAEEEERQARVEQIKDEITERVLARANEQIAQLMAENDKLTKLLENKGDTND